VLAAEDPDASDDGSESSSEDDEAPAEPELDDELSRHRVAFPVLAEQAIGAASKSVEFNWRHATAMVAATGSHYFELNNFDSLRAGGVARVPYDKFILELGGAWVWVWDTPSSRQLALTPYRQPGRPARIELDLTVGFPVAEGVVTTFPRLFPAVELVFSPYAGLRYVLYPTAFQGMKAREIAGAVVSPTLTDDELENLEEVRLDAMEVDPARYGILVGFGNEIYFKQGVFVMPRVMFAVPVFAPVTESDLRFWADLSLTIGVAF